MGERTPLLLCLAVGLALASCSLPRRSAQSIRGQILQHTPQGSGYTEVMKYVKTQGWPVSVQSSGLEAKNIGMKPARVVRHRVVQAYLGHYNDLPWVVNVNCYWAFDEQDKLIDVFVEKQIDTP